MRLDIKKAFAITGLVVCLLALLAIVLIWIYLPGLVSELIDIPDQIGNRNELDTEGRHLILMDAYAILVVSVVCDALVACFLIGIIREREHTKGLGVLLLSTAGCCFGEAFLFTLLISQFQMALFVVCFSLALGLCMLIVRHLLRQAAQIKQENEFTI